MVSLKKKGDRKSQGVEHSLYIGALVQFRGTRVVPWLMALQRVERQQSPLNTTGHQTTTQSY
jgi:hypothetical protein